MPHLGEQCHVCPHLVVVSGLAVAEFEVDDYRLLSVGDDTVGSAFGHPLFLVVPHQDVTFVIHGPMVVEPSGHGLVFQDVVQQSAYAFEGELRSIEHTLGFQLGEHLVDVVGGPDARKDAVHDFAYVDIAGVVLFFIGILRLDKLAALVALSEHGGIGKALRVHFDAVG